MRARTTIVLAVIAAVLVIIAISSRRAERSRERIDSGPIFPEAYWESAAEIRLIAGEDSVHLRKQGRRWLVRTEGDYPADTTAIRGMLEKAESFDRRHLRSTSPEMQATFEVDDSSGTEVLLSNDQGEALAHFRVGKNGPDFRSQYIRPVGSNEVFLIPEYLRSSFDARRATWRDRAIFNFEWERAQWLYMEPAEGEPVEIVKDLQGNYQISSPDSVPAKKNLVESTLRALARLRSDAFPDTVPTLTRAGLDPPRQRVEVRLEDGGYRALNIGNETEKSRVYVKKDDAPTIFLLTKGRLSSLIRDFETLKEEPPAAPPAPAPAEPEPSPQGE
ncbi:MAG: DUF4340 domain-containing protein [Candidatus Eisenbacteria sp.]|nr:DUF4340 domain-containing protein [Candidatus Eisenbacteria bacterium]